METETKNFIEVKEFQKRILDCITSGKVDEYFNASIFTNSENGKAAIIFGMCIAATLTCECEQISVKYDKMGESI